jgi:hypothetical protein
MRWIVLAALLAAGPAIAHPLWWTQPTQFEDGSLLALSDIASTTIEWSDGATFGVVTGSRVVLGTAASAVMPDPPAGSTRCYRVRTTAISKGGLTSDPPSPVWCKVMPALAVEPKSPTSLGGN